MTYFNCKTSHGTETLDELNREDFSSFAEYKTERKRLIREYHMCGQYVYTSTRSTNDWKNR